ncbi:hypothetical protein G9A89_020512 [Geosiphon pyriformis]|nr:hypothetical protein G9A89_020512 [Geosiphon pyriformis]
MDLLAKLYKRKSVSISHLAVFDGKSWAQVVLPAGSSDGFCFASGSGSSFPSTSDLIGGLSPVSANNSSLDAYLALLEQFLKLLADQVSGILCKLSKIKMVQQVLFPFLKVLATLVAAERDLALDIIVDGPEVVLSPSSFISSSILVLSQSSLRILTTKVGSLKSKLFSFDKVRLLVCEFGSFAILFVPMSGLIWKIATCNIWGINVPAKQNNVVCWHKDSGNMVSIVMETKLKPSIRPWIMNKFEDVHIFTSGLDSGFFGAGVAIIINNSLARHVSKIEEVPGRIISVHLLFKGRVLVSIIGLYACASSGDQFEQTFNVNSFIAQVVNASSFVVLGSNFNECSSKKSASYGFCLNLGLVNFFGGHSLAGAFTWSNSKGVKKVINHILVSKFLILAVASHKIGSVSEFFDTNHKAVSVSVSLGGLLNDCWKFKLKGVNECSVGKFLKRSVDFYAAKHISNLDNMWNILKEVVVDSADDIFFRLWFSEFEDIRFKLSSKFHGLELLMFKIASSLNLGLDLETGYLVNTWSSIDNIKTSKVCVIIDMNSKIEDILHHILVVKKGYCKSKYHKSKVTRDDSIKKTISRYMENFCTVKSSIDTIIEGWTRKCLYALLDYVGDNTFSGVMSNVNMKKLLQVIRNLPDGKAAGLSGTSIQSLIFAIGSIVEDALEKNRKLWLVLQNMYKTYNSVSWSHLLNSLIKIKMCSHFINFFGNIHNSRFNQVMTDFGLSDGYTVHDGLDQEEVFLPLLWHIFYDPLLCKVKKHEQLYGYQMCLRFYAKFGKSDQNNNRTLFFAAGVFVNDTIWIGNCLAVMQNILNIASEFFSINNISINSEKTVAISINQGVKEAELFISGSSISVAKRTKVHNDIKFFLNVVLRKTITKKQFLYLVFAVLHSIICYRLQFSFASKGVCEKWDKLLRKRLKFKANLPRDFPSMALHHSKLYGLKPFEQVLSESLLANLINFSNADAPAPSLFSVLASCKASLGDAFSNVFQAGTGVPILDVLGLDGYLSVKKSLIKYGLIFANQFLDHHVDVVFHSAPTIFFHDIGFTSEHLLAFGHESIEVYIDGSVKSLGSIGICGGAAAYFPRANTSVSIKVLGLLSSTLVELQAITLALKCVPVSSTVELFTDSQALLDICKFDIGMSVPDFRHKIEDRSVSGNTRHFVKNLFDAINFVKWDSRCDTSVVEVGDAGEIDIHKSFNVWHPDSRICSGYTSLSSIFMWSYLMKSLHRHLPVVIRKKLYNPRYSSIICIRCGIVENSDYLFLCSHNNNAKRIVLFFIRERWCEIAGDSTIESGMINSLHEAKLSFSLYMLLAKRFVLKNWTADAIWCLGLDSDGRTIIDLVYSLAKCHRSDI